MLLPNACLHWYLLRVLCRSRSFLEHLSIPDSAFACIGRQLEVLCQFKSIHWTRILTEPTEHAARKVVGKRRQVLAVGLLVPNTRHDNQVFRAGQRAKIAGDAESFIIVGINIEPWCAPITFSYFRPLGRVLLSVNVLWILIAERDPKRLKQIHQQDLLCESAHKLPPRAASYPTTFYIYILTTSASSPGNSPIMVGVVMSQRRERGVESSTHSIRDRCAPGARRI